jgi:hypothetical protein
LAPSSEDGLIHFFSSFRLLEVACSDREAARATEDGRDDDVAIGRRAVSERLRIDLVEVA